MNSICSLLVLVSGVANGQIPTPAKSRVEIEIAVDPGLQANVASQRWAKTLGDLGLDGVRFRPLKNGDRPEVKQQGAGPTALIQITAQLNNRGALVTSGGQFGPSDNAKLKKWLADLQAGGAVPGERKTVFGLTGEQFAAAKKTLSTPIGFSTKGMRPETAIAQIKPLLALQLVIDPAFERSVIADDPLRDELQGLSAGTALAAIARPAGGVLLPRPAGKEVQLALTSPQVGGEMWPIGWPPEEKDEQKLVPALYEFIPVDIDGVPASDAITALQRRIQVPMLFDHNNMVRQRIDLKKPVKVPPGKKYYRQIFERVLNQAGLRSEVRVDDAGKPLIWVTPM
jgi:hypothetical protein